MPELAYDFADNYPNYETSKDTVYQRTTIVVHPVVSPTYLANVGGIIEKISLTPNVDKTTGELNKWDDIWKIDKLIKDTLKKGIMIPDTHKLKDYLHNFPELIDILPSVCKLTKDKFPPPDSQISLEVDHDIEDIDQYLVLYVRQVHYADNIMEVIDEIRSNYSDSLLGERGWLLVTTDFASPE
jgi:hypothetical protein